MRIHLLHRKVAYLIEAIISFLFIANVIIHIAACSGQSRTAANPIVSSNESTSMKETASPVVSYESYNFNEPEKYTLSKKLLEISALTIDNNMNDLYALNDEKAIIYRLSAKGEIMDEVDFGKNADYEGIEKVDNTIYVLRSNGKMITYDLDNTENIKTYNNPLTLTNDTEGLGYDPITKSLLIACKDSPNITANPKLKKTKSVYAVSLATMEMNESPFL